VKPWSYYFVGFGFEGAFFLLYLLVPSSLVFFLVYPESEAESSSSSSEFFTFFLRFVFTVPSSYSASCYILAYFSVFAYYSATTFFFFFLETVFTDSPYNFTSADSSVLFETLEDAAIVLSRVDSSSFFLLGFFFFFGFDCSYSDSSDSSLSFFFLGFDLDLDFFLVGA
jgi:hypothetical protein